MKCDAFRYGAQCLATSVFLTAAVGAGVPAAAAQEPPIVRLSAAERDRIGLSVVTATQATGTREIPVVGEITAAPDAVYHARSPIEGRIENVYVAPGDRVRRGQTLATLHSHDVHHAVSELRVAQQRLKMARNQESNGQALYEVEGISRIELERRQLAVFEAELAEQNAVLELEDMGFTSDEIEQFPEEMVHGELPVRSALSGVVLEVHVATSDRIDRLQDLLVIGDLKRLELALQMPPEAAGRTRPGDLVRFAPVGRATCCEARLQTRVPTVDPTTRTVRVRARIEMDGGDGPSRLVPGTFVEGVLTPSATSDELGAQNIAITVPAAAVVRVEPSDIVFVEQAAGEYRAQVVVVDSVTDGTALLRSGVAGGERVVERGAFLLKSKLVAGEIEP